ncbi:MAG: ATP-binding cassette domain-containing protein, partial [Traorella sp.]
SLFHVAMNGVSASEKLFKFLDEEVDEDGIYDEFAFETIQLNHVCFSYDEKRVVDDVCLELKPESLCCLVGESGCGKSTIASLIMKQYKPDVGEITINEIDLTKIKRETWMNTCTYVSSDPFLFKGSIRDNLMMGKKTNDEEYIEVLKKVKIYDYLKNENGLDTMILEKGSNFSKGQCQRIAFARALLKDSAFYIFDEATSNIDVESENDLMQLIQELSKEKGVLFITHRLMNVVESDVIYVMKNAQIVGVGKHEELLKTSSDYQELWMSQMELENWKGEEHGK